MAKHKKYESNVEQIIEYNVDKKVPIAETIILYEYGTGEPLGEIRKLSTLKDFSIRGGGVEDGKLYLVVAKLPRLIDKD